MASVSAASVRQRRNGGSIIIAVEYGATSNDSCGARRNYRRHIIRVYATVHFEFDIPVADHLSDPANFPQL